MAGILGTTMQPPAQPAAGQMQMALERVVMAALKVIHTPQISQQLIQMMQKAGDPATGIAQATYLIMSQLYEKSNHTIPPQILLHAAAVVMREIGVVGQTARLFQMTPALGQQALQILVKLYQQGVQAAQQGAAQPAQPAPQAVGA